MNCCQGAAICCHDEQRCCVEVQERLHGLHLVFIRPLLLSPCSFIEVVFPTAVTFNLLSHHSGASLHWPTVGSHCRSTSTSWLSAPDATLEGLMLLKEMLLILFSLQNLENSSFSCSNKAANSSLEKESIPEVLYRGCRSSTDH